MLRAPSILSMARLTAGFLSRRNHLGHSWDAAFSVLRSGRCAGVSMDCFGTLLARGSTDWEQHILAETVGFEAGYSQPRAKRLFKKALEQAKLVAGGDQEPAAKSIWTEYCIALGVPDMATQLSAHELKLLEITSNAADRALPFVDAVKNLQLPWIVCSDTRWPASELCWLLREKGFDIPLESVFCSCDHRKSKFRGGLYSVAYKHLIEALGRQVPPRTILHVGDNFLADNCSAASFGMLTVNVPPACRQTEPAADTIGTYLELARQDIALGIRCA
jgi:FMN phosphatase YigB (HAD superfamily)